MMPTLAALCLARDLDMDQAGEDELARVWTKVEQIRKKRAAKPKHSPLPAAPQLSTDVPAEQFKLALREWRDTLLALHTYMATVLGKPAPVELFARVSAAFEAMGRAIDRPAIVIGDVQP